ncbi:PREDICTED: exonuclease V-like [Amphimedon queenslandica]|uniref:PD-(D/E)XK endonuclease-like domain-containing protein n=1 Tax=Amphimedon queenslandica TaxID=400682 RepID=A0AAN0JJ32_AMPQE|nr:PREDICTED: exonuclease V-like [Amphimedon queenslandica]|eukprot:XP_019856984.1 PREDICTED: exonuclease V-like [Amphimedon queenslandica]
MNMASLGNIIKEGKEGIGGEGVDCQVLEDEEFELVCHVTDLATLESELSEVRKHVAVQRNAGVYQPYKVFGRGSTSVQISDIARGLWCEQQVEYGHLYPYLRRTEGWRRVQAEKRTVIQQRTPVMKAGSHIHYKKEIEIHDVPIQVVAPTREDKWAVDLINTYIKLAQISRGGIGAEIKIYCAFEDTVLAGIIDQLQYCKEDHSLILMEHKTRKSNTLPQEEQKRGHYLQLMLYKFILDSFTSGTTNYCNVAKALGLKLSQILGPGPIEHAYNTGLLHNDLLLSPNGASMGDICSQSNKPQTSFSHNSSFSSDPTKTNRSNNFLRIIPLTQK